MWIRECFCVLPHLLWQRKWVENISCQRGFCSFLQQRIAKFPTHLQQAKPSVSLQQSFSKMPRSWFGVITNTFGGDFFLLAYAVEAPSAISLRTKSPNKMLCVVFGITQKTIRPWFWRITILIYQRIKWYYGNRLTRRGKHRRVDWFKQSKFPVLLEYCSTNLI